MKHCCAHLCLTPIFFDCAVRCSACPLFAGLLPVTAYMPVPGYSGYMPYGAYPGMMMGGMGYPMQYGAMGYPMQQQTVPGVVPGGMQRSHQAAPQYGYSGMQGEQRAGSSSRAASESQAGSSKGAARKQQPQSKNEGGAEGVKLPDNLNPTAGEASAGTPPASS